MSRTTRFGGLAVVLAAFHALHAAEWPQFRGPNNRDAISPDKGLLKEWPADGPTLAWKAENLGTGFSSVSIAGGKVFTMGDRDDSCWIVALDLKDGKELWAAKISRGSQQRDLGGYPGPRCIPTVDGDLVYALGPFGDLVCVQAKDGKEVWRKSLNRDFKGRMMSGWGYSESPTIDGDRVICTPGGKEAAMVALDKKTGATVWKCENPDEDGAGYASIVIAEIGGVRQYITLLGGGLIGVSAKDGKLLWRYKKIANRTANIPTSIVKGDLVFCTTGYPQGGSALLKIVAKDGEFSVEEAWYHRADVFQNHHGGVILVGDHLYAGHGHNAGAPICVEFATGKQAWKERSIGNGSAAIGYADGHLYFRYENGVVALVEANPKEFKLKSKFTLPRPPGGGGGRRGQPSWPHPVILDGKLYLREQDTLYVYDVKAR